MLNRRIFLKTTIATGTALTLNPFSFAAKEKPLRWRNVQEEEPKEPQIILVYDKPNNRFLWSRVTSLLYFSKERADFRLLWRCLSKSYVTLSNYDRRTKGNLGRCFDGMRPDHYPEFSYHLLETKRTFWMPFTEIIEAPLSNNLALIKPNTDAILVHHVPNTLIFIEKKRVEPSGYDIFTPCQIIGNLRKNPFGRVGVYVDVNTKTSANAAFYMGRDGKHVEWFILPKV